MAQEKEFTSGEFSSDAEAENPLDEVGITLDGERFECLGRLSVLDMSELAAKAIDPDLADAAEAASIYQTLSLAFGEEFPRLRAHMREHKTPDATVLQILQYINEAMQQGIERITGRPTEPSSSSPAGPVGTADRPVRSISLSGSKAGRPATAKQRTPRKTGREGAARRTG